MKFIKLYSNDAIFKTIIFSENSNINFILSDGHSVGKTKLLELIDFCLLKDKPSFLKLERFKEKIDLSFYLEIKVADMFITIKRSINKRGGNYLKKSSHTIDCLNEKEFDCDGGQEKVLEYLNNLLDFQLADKKIQFRKYLNYFLRTQDDQSDVFKLNKFKGKDIDYKPVISSLLGINGFKIREKYEIENNIERLEKEIKVLEFDVGIDTTKDYIIEEINVLQKMKLEKENRFKEFDFYLEENKISKDLVDNIESDISSLNKKRNSLNREVEYINKATNDNLLIDMSELNELFEELNISFPKDIKIEYNKVIEFNKNLTNERMEILQDNKKSFIIDLEVIEKELYSLNKKRKDMLSVLTDSDTMSKFKKIEKEIIEIETNINKEKLKLEKFELLESKITEIDTKSDTLKSVVTEIQMSISEFNKASLIKTNIGIFANLMFNEEALFSVGLNAHKNIEFNLKLSNNNNFDNKRDEGHTFRKLLSFLFSIAILVSYKDRGFFKFAVLDSPFDGDKTDYQDGLYRLIEKVSSEYDMQIILTTVEDEIKNDELSNEAKRHTIRYLKENDKLIGEF
ncbi:MAG: hypothetical protein DRG78_15885 [Epsilonproteobacteria bacterium]|nr:MAG: hypothetical protein DRG78_15885 [Campylobacterota bacterium]